MQLKLPSKRCEMTSMDEIHVFITLFASCCVCSFLCPAFLISISTLLVVFVYKYFPTIRYSLWNTDCEINNKVPWAGNFILIQERMQGLRYLIQGSSSLQSGYAQARLYFLSIAEKVVLTSRRGPWKLVQDSNSIDQSSYGDFRETHSRAHQCSIRKAFATCGC